MNVDFPDPDGPVSATNSAGITSSVHAAQRAHLRLAEVVGLRQFADGDQRRPFIVLTSPSRRRPAGCRQAAAESAAMR